MALPEVLKPRREDRASFVERLKTLPQESQEQIMYAYDFAKLAHRGQMREGGQRYFEHVREVAIIGIDECKILDPVLIAAALTHDTAEDSVAYGNTRNIVHSKWREKAEEKATALLGKETSVIMLALTKPFIDNVEVNTKDDKDYMYHKQLVAIGPDGILVKMWDRLHNLRTLDARSLENQQKIIRETRNEYFPIFNIAKGKYPEQVEYLLAEMVKAMNALGH